jgi:tRNA threonylcarbamoyl adenosine modification protein YeaZ
MPFIPAETQRPQRKRKEEMQEASREQVILAIESAIAGGSLSLIRGGTEIANWVGTAERSRAEDLLVNIEAMLSENAISRRDIGLIAVSAGPGSFTGIRIGIATALGLKAGLGIPMSSVSALKAIAQNSRRPLEVSALMAAVPVGRNSICIQSFDVGPDLIRGTAAPRTVPQAELDGMVDSASAIVMHGSLAKEYAGRPLVIDVGENIAYAVGRAAMPGVIAEPLFVSKSF